MRISALGGAWLLVSGLSVLSGSLYYDQANISGWMIYAPAAEAALEGPVQAITAQIFTLIGSVAAGATAVLVAVCALLYATGRRFGHWALRVTAVLVFVLLALCAMVVVVANVGDDSAAVFSTPAWLLILEWAAVLLALTGAGITTARLWNFA